MKKKIDSKHKKKGSYKLLTTIFVICLIAITIAGVFYGTYYYMVNQSTSSYQTKMKLIVSDIGQTNKKVGALIKGQTIDTELVKKELPKHVTKLAEIRDSLKDLTPANSQKQMQIYLEEGLQNNILLFRQITLIVENPNSKDLSTTLNDLKNYNDQMLNNYSAYQNKSFDILLPNETRDFIANADKYANQLVKVQKETDTKVKQIMDFAEKIDTLINKFIPIKTDLGPSLQKIRTGSGTFDDALGQIDDAKDKFSDIQKNLQTLKAPDEGKSIYNSFSRILDDYKIFNSELRYAVSTEKLKTKSTPLTSNELKDIYASSSSKFADLSAKYDTFLKAYAEFKGKYIK